MSEKERKGLAINIGVYVGDCVRKEVGDWRSYVETMVETTNKLLDYFMIPLFFAVSLREWNLPAEDNPILENINNTSAIPSEMIKEDPNIPKKMFLCWLLNGASVITEEEIKVGFVSGSFKGIGGFCAPGSQDDPGEVLVTSYGDVNKDTLVFAHEVFHKLGLPHNKSQESLMYEVPSKFALDEADKKKLIQFIHVARMTKGMLAGTGI